MQEQIIITNYFNPTFSLLRDQDQASFLNRNLVPLSIVIYTWSYLAEVKRLYWDKTNAIHWVLRTIVKLKLIL